MGVSGATRLLQSRLENGFSANKGWKCCWQRLSSHEAASSECGFGVRDRWCCVSEQLTERDESDAGKKGAAELWVKVAASPLLRCFPPTGNFQGNSPSLCLIPSCTLGVPTVNNSRKCRESELLMKYLAEIIRANNSRPSKYAGIVKNYPCK